MKLSSRSSRATGPKIRVPRGWFCGVRSTAALSSKRMSEPSGRRISFVWRTTTARTTSPFFTWAFGIACFTAAMNTSPMEALVPVELPSTGITESSRAPVLSAQRTRVYGRGARRAVLGWPAGSGGGDLCSGHGLLFTLRRKDRVDARGLLEVLLDVLDP